MSHQAEEALLTPASTAPPAVSRRQALRITAVTGIALAFGGWLGGDLLRRTGLHRVRHTRVQLGTLVTITLVHEDAATARRLVELAFDEIERLEAILSRYRPSSPVARLNRDGAVDSPPAELLEVLRAAERYSELTGGAFDITIAPLLGLYASRFGAGLGAPADEELQAALQRVDWRMLRVDDGTVALQRPDMAVTLDGIAKGYVVDRTVRLLTAAGLQRVLVDAGGDVASSILAGANDDAGTRRPWRVGVQHPREAGDLLGTLQLRGESAATSGDYLESFTVDRRFHHIIDPRTGRSPEHTSAVTVVAPTAMDADALSTAAFILGPAAGTELLEALEHTEGMIVTKSGDIVRTTGLARYLG